MSMTAFSAANPDSVAQSVTAFADKSDRPAFKVIEWATLIPLLIEVVPMILGGCKKPASATIEGAKSNVDDRINLGIGLRKSLEKVAPCYELSTGRKLDQSAARAVLVNWCEECDAGQAQEVGNQLSQWQSAWA